MSCQNDGCEERIGPGLERSSEGLDDTDRLNPEISHRDDEQNNVSTASNACKAGTVCASTKNENGTLIDPINDHKIKIEPVQNTTTGNVGFGSVSRIYTMSADIANQKSLRGLDNVPSGSNGRDTEMECTSKNDHNVTQICPTDDQKIQIETGRSLANDSEGLGDADRLNPDVAIDKSLPDRDDVPSGSNGCETGTAGASKLNPGSGNVRGDEGTDDDMNSNQLANFLSQYAGSEESTERHMNPDFWFSDLPRVSQNTSTVDGSNGNVHNKNMIQVRPVGDQRIQMETGLITSTNINRVKLETATENSLPDNELNNLMSESIERDTGTLSALKIQPDGAGNEMDSNEMADHNELADHHMNFDYCDIAPTSASQNTSPADMSNNVNHDPNATQIESNQPKQTEPALNSEINLIRANGNERIFMENGTQTDDFDEVPGDRSEDEDQEIFHDILDIEDLMGDMGVEEFIPWFRRNNNDEDNKSDTGEMPEPEAFRENQWSLDSSQGIKVGKFGCYYEGSIYDKKMHGYGRLILRDREQFIEGKWDANRLIELNFTQLSFEFRNQTIFIIKQKDTYLISICEEKFVARATTSSMGDLNLTAQIPTIKSSLFKKFTINYIIEDALISQREALLKTFESSLRETASEDANAINRAAILILLSRYSRQRDAGKVLSAIERDRCISNSLRVAAQNLLALENDFSDRKLDMFKFSSGIEEQRHLDLRTIIYNTYTERIAEHRQMLINKCPNALHSMLAVIERLPADKILYITKEDVSIFEHLVSLSNSEHYMEFLEWLLDGFDKKLRKIEAYTLPSEVIPLMFPVYGFLFKSFSEIVSEICSGSDDSSIADMLKYKYGVWRLKENIKWHSDEDAQTKKQKILKFFKVSKKKLTLGRKSLEIQYKFIFTLLMTFSSENYCKTQKYEYTFKILETDKKSSWWQRGLTFLKETIGWEQALKDSPVERLVWLYILDHTVHELFRDDQSVENRNIDIGTLYAPLLQGHMHFVAKSGSNSYESFRVLTHSILRFLVSTAPYFRSEQERASIDGEILELQMKTITKASDEMNKDPSAFVSFKDLIAEYNRYWGLRLFITLETSGYFATDIAAVMQRFLAIVTVSLKKTASIPTLVAYFRSLNDFFDDFKGIDFISSWYVKSNFYNADVMERIDNKLSSGVNCSYRVVDIDKYIKVVGSHSVPQHYILQIMTGLLGCIERCLEQTGDERMPSIQMERTGVLLDAIRRSLLYLKDQPDYVDFETFKKESIDPFERILDGNAKSLSMDEYKKRIEVIKESFWYIRKMDELGIEQALQKLKSVNSCYISSELLDCYNLYLDKYNFYIANYNSLLSNGKSHRESLAAVKESIELPKAMNFTKWTKKFKTEEIPLILAGLSAVWSILVSKDVSSTGKFLKPHCIQLLCVMRLLSVDQSEDTRNHLAQVLTGQGKSVILGLLSSTLALTGHNVRVLCYSSYLSSRDQNDFKEFFNMFRITSKIHYGTFENMAEGFLNPKCNGIKKCLRQLVIDRVLGINEASLGSVTTETENTILLIDEVDVFFTNRFYGNVFCSVTRTKIPGLANVQEKMWSIAKGSKYEATEVVSLTEKYIDNEVKSGNMAVREFNAFRFKPRQQPLSLLFDDPDGNLQVKEYTNRSLMEEHLLKMAKMALLVGNGKKINGFRINDNGQICMMDTDGKYVTHFFSGYGNTFNYFRLKGSDFNHKNFENYGYILLYSGEISYARLPSQFKLILGVSGTLKDLSEHERKGIETYNINNYSILPSFFGESNLKFNDNSNFMCLPKERDWLTTIYDKTNQIVKSFGAALIFFDTETQLNLFKNEYKSKFDRFNEITENTAGNRRDVYINEAGLSGAVTLATRGMGRGVDYKSSLAVEKNGGIHVIQTFCSVDVKEEIQIKGRTARKDNKGSYELVVCREHLIEEKIIGESDADPPSYSRLHQIRVELMNKRGSANAARIERSERNHQISMKYYGLSS